MHVVLPNCYTRQLFTPEDVLMLRELYYKLYCVSSISQVEVCLSYKKYKTLCINNKQLGSYKSRSCSSSVVLAVWPHDLFGTAYSSLESPILQRPVRINYFAHHNIKVNGNTYEHTLMCCSWFQLHPEKDTYGKPVTIWENSLFETGIYNILPVQFIVSRTVSLVDNIGGLGHALVVVPCIDF